MSNSRPALVVAVCRPLEFSALALVFAFAFAFAFTFAARAAAPEELRLLTFNLWVGGDAGGQPLARSVDVVRLARADVAGFQETLGAAQGNRRPDNGRKIAEALGWSYHDQGGGKGIASRHPILSPTPGGHGALIRLPSGREIAVFNVHLAHADLVVRPYPSDHRAVVATVWVGSR